jgi:hypothetical protein
VSGVAGRTRIGERALSRIVVAVAADSLGVLADRVHVELGDRSGVLTAAIRTPISVRDGVTVLEQAGLAQDLVRSRVPELTRREIGPVRVRLVGVDRRPTSRVR